MEENLIKQRLLEKFIMGEFVKGKLSSEITVSDMLVFIQTKLGKSLPESAEFLRSVICINN